MLIFSSYFACKNFCHFYVFPLDFLFVGFSALQTEKTDVMPSGGDHRQPFEKQNDRQPDDLWHLQENVTLPQGIVSLLQSPAKKP